MRTSRAINRGAALLLCFALNGCLASEEPQLSINSSVAQSCSISPGSTGTFVFHVRPSVQGAVLPEILSGYLNQSLAFDECQPTVGIEIERYDQFNATISVRLSPGTKLYDVFFDTHGAPLTSAHLDYRIHGRRWCSDDPLTYWQGQLDAPGWQPHGTDVCGFAELSVDIE